jgi:hypothetical protein
VPFPHSSGSTYGELSDYRSRSTGSCAVAPLTIQSKIVRRRQMTVRVLSDMNA